MDELKAKDYLAAWTDFISLLLLAFAILVAGIEPHRRVWGRSILRHTLIIFAVSSNVIFSAARLIFEGVLVETGPREFLLAAVAYCARWLWLYVGISRSGSRSRKAFKIALHLKDLKTVRLGKSTKKENSDTQEQSRGRRESLHAFLSGLSPWRAFSSKKAETDAQKGLEKSGGRHNEMELVIRRGARKKPRGEFYWRGVEEKVTPHDLDGDIVHFVRLVERELHGDHLNVIGTYDYKKQLDAEGTDGLYKKIYDLVLTCDRVSPEFQVDYSSFLTEFAGVNADTAPAVRTESVNTRQLGNVARRVAADACFYVTHDEAELRTKRQVELINQCIEHAAASYLRLDTDERESGDVNIPLTNSEVNV